MDKEINTQSVERYVCVLAILSKLSSGSIPCGVPPDCLSTLAKIVETSMGGSSGGVS